VASDLSNWPNPAEAPDPADLSRCVHCGLCLNSCPTFTITGMEAESPRGRIALARAVESGDLLITPSVEQHWDLCLQCRACEAVCPSNVPYGRIMEHVRAQVSTEPVSNKFARRVRRVLLRNVIGNATVLRLAMLPARAYAQSRGRRWFEATGMPRHIPLLGRLLLQLPRRPGRPVRPGTKLAIPSTSGRTAALFTGCVMGELFGNAHRSTARVLARRGVACEATEGQGCCGALHAHDGDIEFARALAKKNIEAFEASAPQPIIVNSAGCGAAMKEYGQLLAGDDEYRERAAAFSDRVVDFAEYISSFPGVPAVSTETVSYQHACHLAHAQRIREQPQQLLAGVEGMQRVDGAGSDMCCGAAGIYSLVQPAMSASLRALKREQFRASDPGAIVTANPGCQMQYQLAVAEAGLRAEVLHIAEFLDKAERSAEH
jgi:glycolate oxidase iron-sulfur subunit